MPRGKNELEQEARRKPVVYLNHALLDSSFAFVCNSPTESLGYLLADAGYDVWFGNNRGNTYSKNHTTLPTDSEAFWNFTYDDMALSDLPTHIGYVLNSTGAATLSYIGHSQGTIQAFAGFSVDQQLAARINVFLAMAPVAYVHHQRGEFLHLLAAIDTDKLFYALGVKDFLPSGFLTKFAPSLCHLIPRGCVNTIELIVGPSHHTNVSRVPVYVSETPAGTSVKNMVHWGQAIRKEFFRMYDEGSAAKNLARYNQTTPPAYNLTQLTVPTVLYTGAEDYLADSADVATLMAQLAPGVLLKRFNLPTYAHLDFTWADDANTFLYPDMLQVLANYSSH